MHDGFEILAGGERHRIDLKRFSGGQSVLVDGQTELTRDLMDVRDAAALPTVYEADDVAIADFDYVRSERGFALCSMRSLTRSPYYVRVPLRDRVESWSDDAFSQELRLRLDDVGGERLVTGPSIEKSIAPLRSAENYVGLPLDFGASP